MRDTPASDHLDLWRGIDDAIWREAARAPQQVRPCVSPVRVTFAAIPNVAAMPNVSTALVSPAKTQLAVQPRVKLLETA